MVREGDDVEGWPLHWTGQLHRCLIHAEVLALVAPSASLIVNRAVAFAAVIAYASLSWPFSRTNSEIEAPAWFASRKRKLQSTVQAQLEKV